MSDASDTPPDSAVTGNRLPTPFGKRYRIGRIVLILGNLLVVATFFSPWLDLSTTFGEHPGTYGYGPWYLLQRGIPLVNAVGLVVPFLAILACTAALLVGWGRRPGNSLLMVLAILSGSGLLVTLLVLGVLPTGLNLVYPYYTTQLDYGAWPAIGSFVCMLLGVLIIWPE